MCARGTKYEDPFDREATSSTIAVCLDKRLNVVDRYASPSMAQSRRD